MRCEEDANPTIQRERPRELAELVELACEGLPRDLSDRKEGSIVSAGEQLAASIATAESTRPRYQQHRLSLGQ